ncbi:MAG: chemotaxis protein CheW [Myxococcota bacterium]|nr:chemotaxis protein CheW [Myxococcota bacterium]
MSERVDLQEFVGAFVAEAEELAAAANLSLLEIEVANTEGTTRPRIVRDLFRALHTIKGLAGMMGVEPIVEIAHALETLIRSADRAGGLLSPKAVEIALQGIGEISERVQAVAERRQVAGIPVQLIATIASIDAEPAATRLIKKIPSGWEGRLTVGELQQLDHAHDTAIPVWAVTFMPSASNVTRGITIASVRRDLAAIGELVRVFPRALAGPGDATGVAFDMLLISKASRDVIAATAATELVDIVAVVAHSAAAVAEIAASGAPDAPGAPDRDDHVTAIGRAVVRVDLSRLDELQEQLSLLIVSRFRLEHEIAAIAKLGHDVRRLREIAQLQGRQLRDLRRAILRARMVRVADVLEPLNLLVRGLARSTRRPVQLVLEAGDTELDKAVADRLLPALIHLVRNAVDHAIEAPEERAAAGKPTTGTVRVSCVAVAANHIELVVRDDGQGIDRDAIARRAKRPIASDAELLEVLTRPGFSTREVATTTSGRGLGMDIVQRVAVAELGGELALQTTLGAGTAFTLRVPITIAVMDVFSFQCGAQCFVVPASLVEEIFEVSAETVSVGPSPPRPGAGASTNSAVSLFEHRGQAIPLLSLGALLDIDSGARARKALVIRRNGQPMAFSVDRMIGRQEVVVRSIDDPLVTVPGITGTTDLGDGRPTLMLDLHELATVYRDRVAS